MQSNHKQKKCEQSRRNSYRLQLSQKVSLYQIDIDIESVTEFPCLLGHSVGKKGTHVSLTVFSVF